MTRAKFTVLIPCFVFLTACVKSKQNTDTNTKPITSADQAAPINPRTSQEQNSDAQASTDKADAQSKDRKSTSAQSSQGTSQLFVLSSSSPLVSCLTNEIGSSPITINFLNGIFGKVALGGHQSSLKIEQTDISLTPSGWIFFKKENQLSLVLSLKQAEKEKWIKVNFVSPRPWQLTKDLDTLAFKSSLLKTDVNLVGVLESRGKNLNFTSRCFDTIHTPPTQTDFPSIAWPSSSNAFTTNLQVGQFERLHPRTTFHELETSSCSLLIANTTDTQAARSTINTCIDKGAIKKESLEVLCDLETLRPSQTYTDYKTQRAVTERLFQLDQLRNHSSSHTPAQFSLDVEEFEVSQSTFENKSLVEPDSALLYKVESVLNEVNMGLASCSE